MQRAISILLVIAGVVFAAWVLLSIAFSTATAPAWVLPLAVVLIGVGVLVGSI